MKNASNKHTVSMTIRTDYDTKARASALFSDLGLDMSTAVNIFLRQAVRCNGIPFEVHSEIPNGVTLKAIEDAENGNDIHGPFESVAQMMEELNA